jgi:hypothetical protein
MKVKRVYILLCLVLLLAGCASQQPVTPTLTPSRTALPPSATREFRLIPSWTPTPSAPPSATPTRRPTATPDLTLRPYFTAQPNYTPGSGQGIATPDLRSSLPWLDRFSFSAEDQPFLLFDLPYDPAAWQLETVFTPGGLGYQLAHRGITGCVLSQTTGGNASDDMLVEYTDEVLGNTAYYIGQATEDGEPVFVTYCTSYADTPTCFIAYPGASERRCLAEAEGMLAGITFLTNPRYTSAPNIWGCRDEQNNPGLCQVSFSQPLDAVSLPAEGAGWAVGEDGLILRQAGGDWQRVENPAVGALFDVFFLDETHGWAAGEGGTILRWDGVDWTTDYAYTAPEDDPSGAAWVIQTLDFSGPEDGWAAGAITYPDGRSQSLLLHWNGLRWMPVGDLPGCESCGFNAVLALNSRDVWLAGGGRFCQGDVEGVCPDSARLWHWDGSAWLDTPARGASWLYALAQGPSGELWAAGMEYVVSIANASAQARGSVFAWNGAEWNLLSLPPNSGGIYALAVLADGSLVVGGDFSMLRSGHTWSYIASEIAAYGWITDLETGADGRLYALTSSGFLFELRAAP